ncbi:MULTISPECIES: oligosaccharide flippase family protein [Bradyrhizobium]|uniref:O-antigen/teichoic acid export membrane protein n=2 Tax=Bradyrhizobium ottawaense TaxID=931866 RepID=A0ABV4G0F3_9BRAD|nr:MULTISPECIES: oligosaccharide flippase family protein [Bradyrhizobium]WLB49065.1 oligosaccharide flippase family protein [Bradyrhizobium ottawaense]WQN86390.1 oligosaccharide flippase family protein [Bradyrhizobium ottawaense]
MTDDAMKSVQRSILFSALDRYVGLLLVFVVTAVLARLLSPEEFGIYAVANAVTSIIAACFQEFAGASYLIQKRELSRASVQTTFTITLMISAATAFVLFVSAQPIARFFELDRLGRGIEVSSLNLLLLPFSGTIAALFRREMQFGVLAICNLAAGTTIAVVSVGLAMAHFSYMAPLWGGVAGNGVLAVMLLIWRRDFGAMRPSLIDCREIVGFGLYSGAVSVVNVFFGLAPQLFLARVLDFTAVGLYSRATASTQIFDKLVTQVISPVVMPAIVARSKAGGDLKAVYLEAIQLLSAVQWPFLVFMAIMARPIILIWLGPTWLEIVPLVQLLCIGNLALFAACLTYPMFVAVGRVQDALISSLISLPPSLLVILGASFLGVHAVAASALVTLPFQALVAFYFLGRQLGLRPAEFVRTLWRSGAVTVLVIAGVSICAALTEAGGLTSGAGLASAFSVAVLCCWLGLMVTGHPLLQQFHYAAAGLARMAPGLWPSRTAP